MEEVINILIGIVILALGVPFGSWLASITKDELKSGQIWFKLIIVLSLITGVIGFIVGNDVLMFSMFFVAIVTSRSLRNEKGKIKKRK
jgi:hypothetical protein